MCVCVYMLTIKQSIFYKYKHRIRKYSPNVKVSDFLLHFSFQDLG
jgi:ACT domain-containing protein